MYWLLEMSGRFIWNLYEREKQNKQQGSETFNQFAIIDIMIKFYLILQIT